jgi:tetratricopeptide (TPR) repeat protein
MKKLLAFLLLLTSYSFVKAQDITADTTRANGLCAEAKAFQKKRHYDSAIIFYRQALPLYEAHKLWEKYFTAASAEAWSVMKLSKLDSAEKLGEVYLKRCNQLVGEESINAASLLNMLGAVNIYKFSYEKAIAHYQKSLSIKLHLLGENHAEVVRAYVNMAIAYNGHSRYAKALECYQKSLHIRLKLFGEMSADVASSYNGIAQAYINQSHYPEALEYFQKNLEINLKLLGEESVGVANAYANIATVYFLQLKNIQALEYFQKSLRIKFKLLGEKSASVSRTYNNMAIIYNNQLHYEKALEYFQKSLSIDLALFGEKHPRVTTSYGNMASVYQNQSRYEKALEYYQKSLNINLELLGEKHASVAKVYGNMALVYQSQARYEKALEYFQKDLNISLEIFGEKHTSVARAYNNTGLLYRDLRRYDSAAFYHHKAVKAFAIDFEGTQLHQNPKPEQAMEKNELMKFLQHKAKALTLLGQEENALQTYAIAAECAKLAMQEADRENDKLGVAARAHAVHIQAALLHFVRGKRVKL